MRISALILIFLCDIQAIFVVLALPFVIFSYEQNVNLSAVLRPLYASYVKFSTVASHPSFVILSRLEIVMFPGNNREVLMYLRGGHNWVYWGGI